MLQAEVHDAMLHMIQDAPLTNTGSSRQAEPEAAVNLRGQDQAGTTADSGEQHHGAATERIPRPL
jgi:hypothetical protein